MDVMNTAGRTRAIEVSASLLVRHESPAAVKGRPYFEDGTHQSASQHISSSPSKTCKIMKFFENVSKACPASLKKARKQKQFKDLKTIQ